MKYLLICLLLQNILLILLLVRDKNDGEKELFIRQQWTPLNVVFIIFPITIFILVICLLAYYLTGVITLNLLKFLDENYLYFMLPFMTLLIIVLFRSKGQSIRVLGMDKSKLTKDLIIGICVSLLGHIIGIIFYLLIKQVRPDFHLASSPILKEYPSISASFAIFIVAAIFWSPIVEEIIYRGILYSVFRKKYGAYIGIVITSLLFSLIHFTIAPGFILTGIILGILYEKTESIITPTAAHITHNILWLLTEIYFLNY